MTNRAICERFGEIQLFTLCSLGFPPPFDTLDQLPAIEEKALARGRDNPCKWWIVTITAIEILRVENGTQRSSTQPQIIASPDRRRHSLLRARIGWGSSGQGHDIDVDIGSGVRIGIEGCRADVRVCGPRNRMKEITKGATATLGAPGSGGVFADSIITCSMTPSDGPPSARSPVLTQVITIGFGVSGRSVSIPPFARHARLSRVIGQDFNGMAFTMGLLGIPLQSITFAGGQGLTRRLLIPQSASHINFGAAQGITRFITVTWELDI